MVFKNGAITSVRNSIPPIQNRAAIIWRNKESFNIKTVAGFKMQDLNFYLQLATYILPLLFKSTEPF